MSKTFQYLDPVFREIKNITTKINGRLQRDEIVISDKADAVYGGDTSDEFIELMPGKGMSSESWKYVNQSTRAASNPVLKSLSVVSASVSSGYTMYVYGNNVGIGGEINKIAGWVTTISLENVQYKYLCFIIKRTDEEVITSDDLSEVLTISSYDEVLPYALERDLHTVSESVGSVNARLSDFIGIVDFDLEKGNLNSGDERPVASSYNSGTRGRTPVDNPVNLFGNSIIKVESGYRIYPMYNAGDGLVKEGRWVTGEYVVPADSDVWFIISPTTETSGEVIPIETLKEQITIISGNPNSYEQRMSSIERAVSDGEGYMPEYYINHIAAKVEEINQASRFLNGVCFPFITDIHFKANSKNSKYLLKNILDKTACDFVVAGGDYGITRATAAESREIIGNLIDYASYIGHSRWFAINGNHDFTGTESLTWGETYNAIYRPSERWVTDGNVGGWFCIENPVQKTRIICLNSCCPSSFNSDTVMDGLVRIGYAQAKYLVDKLSDGDGYNIIVVSHIASDEAMSGYTSNMGIVQTILESFVAKSAGSSMASGRTLSYDFTSVTNSLIFHLSGHAHADESNVSNGVLSISTTCDAYYRDDGHGAAVGTITEQAFDVYCIDVDAETITAVRVGRGASRKWSFDGTVLSDATD